MTEKFEGVVYKYCDNWYNHVSLDEFKDRPINYLEVGTFYGANLISVANSYASHKDSKLYCIDHWADYKGWEYEGKEETIFQVFKKNVINAGHEDKVTINRGYSNIEIPKLQDDFFDIIFIDADHEPHSVIEDAVLAFRKLKKGGILIFDDYEWGGPNMTKRGIDGFLSGYHKKIEKIGLQKDQLFIRKL